jgi:hypothetical protein
VLYKYPTELINMNRVYDFEVVPAPGATTSETTSRISDVVAIHSTSTDTDTYTGTGGIMYGHNAYFIAEAASMKKNEI